MWALAKMGVTPEAGLLRAMQGRATAVAGEFKPQDVANTVWALATMGVTPRREAAAGDAGAGDGVGGGVHTAGRREHGVGACLFWVSMW